MSTRARVAYFFRTATGSMVRSPFVHVIAIAALAIALVGFGFGQVVSAQLEVLERSLGGEVQLTVYLSADATEDNVSELEQALQRRTSGTVNRVSPAEALGRLSDSLGEGGAGLLGLSENPLPWSLEVFLPEAARAPAALEELASKTRALPFVTEVDYGQAALERLELITRALRLAGLVVFALIFLTAVIVVSATLQLAIFARREEIEIQKLVGGTDRFVRMPFLIEGLLQGLFAAAVAFGVVLGVTRSLEARAGEVVGLVLLNGKFQMDWARLGLQQLGLGVALGLAGSFIAVRRFLRV